VRFCNQCNSWLDDRDFASDTHFARHIGNGIDGGRSSNKGQNDSGAGAALLLIGLFYIIRPIFKIFKKYIQGRWPKVFLYHRNNEVYTFIAFVLSIYLAFNVIGLLSFVGSYIFSS
jgi:hypothetical protein